MLEVNPLAGLQPGYSDLPNMAEMAGMSYSALIDEIVRSALARRDGG
jgi:D-alanine-D-alanine ligase